MEEVGREELEEGIEEEVVEWYNVQWWVLERLAGRQPGSASAGL